MLQSHLFTKTRKDAPKDETAKNADFLIRAGYIHKEMAGVYSYLPLGLRVLNNIANIIREEMNGIGGQEVLLTVLQDRSNWEKTNRWDDKVVDNWFKTELKNGTALGLGFSHEEELTPLVAEYVRSFRDLPLSVYQIQTKFRNEARAKSGIMRGREFLMKDMYSFSHDQKEQDIFYDKAAAAYQRIFDRAGIGAETYMTYASGGTFAKYSHEFQTLTPAGEDIIYICDKCRIAVNEEIIAEQTTCPKCNAPVSDLRKEKAVEVGNIFNLGTKFSEPLELNYTDEKGEKKPVIMGCYGIGLGRLMGTVVEVHGDEKGIVWPATIAPFAVHLIVLAGKETGEKSAKNYADKIYKELVDKGVEVLYDDRDMRAGEKFADSDLLGIPFRAVVSDKTIVKGVVEIKDRETGKEEELSESAFLKKFDTSEKSHGKQKTQ